MSDTPNNGELYAALAAVQAELSVVERDSSNPHLRSRYTSLAALRARINPVLAKHGLCCYHLLGPADVVTVLAHKGGQSIESRSPIIVSSTMRKADDKPTAQEYGSAVTYACRYALAAIVGVASGDDDDDGHAASYPPEPQRAPTARKAPAAPAASVRPAAPPAPPADDAARKRMHMLGVKMYGDGWDAKRHALVEYVTGGKSTSSNDLSAAQLGTLIEGLEKKNQEQHDAHAAANAYPAGHRGGD